MLLPFTRGTDDGVGLVAELAASLPVRRHHFSRGMNLLSVTRRVRGDLGGLCLSGRSVSRYSRICWLRGLDASRYSCV